MCVTPSSVTAIFRAECRLFTTMVETPCLNPASVPRGAQAEDLGRLKQAT
jgi:hypothetical protein